MKRTLRLLTGVSLGLLAFGGCSNSEPATSPPSAASESTQAEPTATAPALPTATSEPAPDSAVEPTPTPAPPPTPTSAPTPEPIFTRIVMPPEAVSGRTRAVFGVTEPVGALPWLGVGHEYSPTTGLSVPLAWAFDQQGDLRYDYLPLPAGATIGNVWSAASAAGRQIAGGRVLEGTTQRAALWSRTEADGWTINADITSDLVTTDDIGASSVSSFEANDLWSLGILWFESESELDADGDVIARRYPITSTDGVGWEIVELPTIDPEEWYLGVWLDQENGFIVAKRIDSDAPASKFFVSTDAGASWQVQEVALADDRAVSVHDARWDDDQWLVVGSMGAEPDRVPVIFEYEGEQWRPRDAELTYSASQPLEDGAIKSIVRLAPDQLVAIADTDRGSRTYTSADGVDWELDPRLWLNRGDDNASAKFRSLAVSRDGTEILVSRGFDPPVWLTPTVIERIEAPGFDRVRRQVDGVVAYAGAYLLSEHATDDPALGSNLWSFDGTDWDFGVTTKDNAQPNFIDIGDGVVSLGSDADGYAKMQVFGGEQLSIEVNDFLGPPGPGTFSSLLTASANGRNLVATSVQRGDASTAYFTFIDLDDPGEITQHAVPSVGAALPAVVCPQLDTGEIVVMLTQNNEVGLLAEVWADRAAPRLGSATLADTAGGDGFSNAVVRGCARAGDGLIAVGATCSEDAIEDGRFTDDGCEAQVWVSDDGFTWTQHPQMSVLTDANMWFALEALGIGPGAVITTHAGRDEDSTLWLVTPDEILAIPDDGLFTLNDFIVNELVLNQSEILVRVGAELFRARIDDMVQRTLPDAAAFAAWRLAAEKTPELQPTPTAPPQPAATAVPLPTSPPAVVATAVPVAVPTATAAPSTQLPICAPGALTTTGSCQCSGSRLFDNGGQCIQRCRSGEDPDGFGGCVRSDGTTVESDGPVVIFESTFEVPADDE